ncbi:HEAT repeat domain-containing protein [Sphaerothrix gracilis]|uniref:HEAT repeat domain-containing protein n=1 Tax=Sphaerothrix gracilis TaxID=3151835 RepID=UPI0031FD2AC1
MASDSGSENSRASSSAKAAAGDALTVEQAIAYLKGSDLSLRVYAAWWLGRFRINDNHAVAALIDALADEDDRTVAGGYPLRRNAARALGKLGDQKAVSALIDSLGCSDFYVREAAAQALEMLGNQKSVPRLMQLLKNEVPGTQPSPEQPIMIQPYDALIEALGTLGAIEAKALIASFLDHPVERVQYAAARALYQIASDTQEAQQYGDRLIQALSHQKLQLRRAALADLAAIGYLPAAKAIAETLAENSLKLIALKGLLEKELQQSDTNQLSYESIQVMQLMDTLL